MGSILPPPPPHQPALSIIIVSYNTCSVTCDCIESIYAAKWRDTFEIIVVDNASHDDSVAEIRKKFPQVRIIANNDNKLFSIANNQGTAIARGEYVLLLNSDTLVYADNLQKMVDFYQTLPDNIICIGPKILNKDGSLQSCGYCNMGYRERFCACFKIDRILPDWLVTHVIGLYGGVKNQYKTRRVGWVSGACMMMRRNLYNNVGGLNEALIFYGEEPEFGYRTTKLGYRTLYYSEAAIIHLGGVSTTKSKKESPTDERISLMRQAAILKETVGYKKGIGMSYIVLAAAYLKRFLMPGKRDYWDNAISWERKVVNFLKMELRSEHS